MGSEQDAPAPSGAERRDAWKEVRVSLEPGDEIARVVPRGGIGRARRGGGGGGGGGLVVVAFNGDGERGAAAAAPQGERRAGATFQGARRKCFLHTHTHTTLHLRNSPPLAFKGN